MIGKDILDLIDIASSDFVDRRISAVEYAERLKDLSRMLPEELEPLSHESAASHIFALEKHGLINEFDARRYLRALGEQVS